VPYCPHVLSPLPPPVLAFVRLVTWRALATILAFSTEEARRDVYNAADALAYPRRWPEARETAAPQEGERPLFVSAPKRATLSY
jgi:hypothetical protein